MTTPLRSSREILLTRLTASGQWERVAETAREWLAEEPENPRAHRSAGQALINLERHREGEPHLAKALAADPENSFTHRLMAIALFGLKRYREADTSIHRAIELDPNDPTNWYQLALMCYRQGDRKEGLKWVGKARALAPNDSNVLNLYALCSEGHGRNSELLEAALAADPENACAHNNLGAHYLDAKKDAAKAEECFRRALTIDPTLKIARRNLFLAIKQRDHIYRILRAPLDLLLSLRRSVLGDGKRNVGAVAIGFVFWIFLARFFLVGLALWFGLFWPLTKFYEFLVIGDLRKKAGEVGSIRGGILGYRGWPVRLRLALFALSLITFWAAAYFLLWSPYQDSPQLEKLRGQLITMVIAGVMFAGLFYLGRRLVKNSTIYYHAWRRKRIVRGLENLET